MSNVQLLWDASALAKRYYAESGRDTVNALFAMTTLLPMLVPYVAYAETASILRRKFNADSLSRIDFTSARFDLEKEVLLGTELALMEVSEAHILTGIALSDAHNINTADASMLASYLEYARSLPNNHKCCLVASDKHLLRAAKSEGLGTLNPQIVSPQEIVQHLAHLP